VSLFETIPANFFSILSSKNKELYVEALMRLHRLMKYELNIELSTFLAELIDLLEERSFEPEDDDDYSEGGLTSSAKARLILNRFIITGWVDKETLDGSFIEVITPQDYAIATMKLLHELEETQVKEYNSLVFSTYSSLNEAYNNQNSHMYEAILSAKSNTEQLVYELKALYHGIRSYMRKVQGQQDINLLLIDHFDKYKELVDRVYHPIKTMDSVYRYITPISEILSGVLGNDDMMDNMRKRAMAVRKYKSEEEAGGEIISAIDYVFDVYQSIGGIVNEIDKKHSMYTKLSVDTIRYRMSADETIGGKLAEILKTYASYPLKNRSTILEIMEKGVQINRQEFLDGRSLWHRNIKSRRVPSVPLEISAENILSAEEARRRMPAFEDRYSLKKLRNYIHKLIDEGGIVSTADIEISGDNEFILLLLSTVRANEKGSGFKAIPENGSKETNGYHIPVITFSRK